MVTGQWKEGAQLTTAHRVSHPGGDRPRTTALPWYRLAALNALAFALVVVTNTIEPAVLGHRTLELAPALKNTVVGLLTFAALLVSILWQPIIGDLSDRTRTRWGRRIPYFFGGGAALIAALYLVAVVPGAAGLLAALLLLQLSSNTVQAPSQALLPDQVPEGQRGAASGWKSAVEILAFVIARQVSGRLVGADQTIGAVSVAALVVAAAVVIVTLAIRRQVDASASTELPQPRGRDAFRFDRRRNPALGPWAVNRALVWGGFVALNTFLLFFVIDVIRLPESEAQRFVGDVSALMGIGLLLIVLPAGWLADRFGRRRLIAASGVSAAAGVALLLLAPSTSVALVAGGILGISVGVFLTASWAMATRIVPAGEAARMLALANIATAAGSGIGRLAGGLIIDPVNRWTGSDAAGYMILYGLAGLAFLAGTAAILRLPADEGAST